MLGVGTQMSFIHLLHNAVVYTSNGVVHPIIGNLILSLHFGSYIRAVGKDHDPTRRRCLYLYSYR